MISVLSTNAVRGALTELAPQFERAHDLTTSITYAATDQLMRRVREGETADVIIVTGAAMKTLQIESAVNAASRVDLGSTGIGVAVRRDAPKPDIGSVDAFKRALLAADSVAWTASGASGQHFAKLIEQLGIAEAVAKKGRGIAGGLVGEVLARGEAQLGIQMISEILAVPGAELVGPLPPELQRILTFSAAIMTRTTQRDGAQKLLQFLSTPAAASVFGARGFQRPA